MGSSSSSSAGAAPEFLPRFRARADANGRLRYDEFVRLALYDEVVGYYRQPRVRVGYAPGTDFFTASTSGPVFGELVATACATLLAPREPRDFTFVEIGPETSGGVLAGVGHPFRETRMLPLGAPLDLAGPCVVFSNELFDAQPFRRFVFRAGAWRERAVACDGEGRLHETEWPDAVDPLTLRALPAAVPEGYHFDAPLAAAELARRIGAQPWSGLFVAFDYGKTWRELAEATPAGTARAYYRHTQSNDLLAQPGEQDLTCHVCWDWLEDALREHGFAGPRLESQEAFLVRHAAKALETIAAAEASGLSPRKRALFQLLHPAHLGQKFQVLHALRA